MADMDFAFDFTTLLVFLITFLLVYLNTRRQSSVPPGPYLWPVIGNLLCLAGNPLRKVEKLRSTYGDVIGLYIGNSLAVVVSGHDAVKEVLVKRGTLFSWRPQTCFDRMGINNSCIPYANGKKWKINRRLAMNAIQRLCFDKLGVGLENKIHEELSFFIERLKAMSEPTDIGLNINLSIANVMCSVLYGSRHGYSDKKLLWYLRTVDHLFKCLLRDQLLLDCFPFLIWIPFGWFRKYERLDSDLKNYFETYYAQIGETYVEGNETCLVHYLMTCSEADGFSAWRKTLDENSDTWAMMNELMCAGSETTASTIKWVLFYLIREPSVQDKVRDEIDKVIGISGTPSVSHRKQLPFLEAVIMEGLRIGHTVPLAVPHSVERDVAFRGFLIPKNTTILLNLASVLKDPRIYPEPEVFKPERFLSDDGSAVVVPEEFIPFSKGPRSCPGESMARIELFLYMATLLQKFCFYLPDDKPEIDGDLGLTYCPKPYKIKIVPRQ